MKGVITTRYKKYVFRDDHAHGKGFWAWDIHDDYTKGTTHKWDKLPKGEVTLFDVDNPPRSIGFIPILL